MCMQASVFGGQFLLSSKTSIVLKEKKYRRGNLFRVKHNDLGMNQLTRVYVDVS